MKESIALHMAQIAVVNSLAIKAEDKLEILHVLMDKEKVALYVEEAEEEGLRK